MKTPYGMELPTSGKGSREATKIARLVVAVAIKYGFTDTRGMISFWTADEWKDEGDYGHNAKLIVDYRQGSDLRKLFDPYEAGRGEVVNEMWETLRAAGYYFELSSAGYAMIYPSIKA